VEHPQISYLSLAYETKNESENLSLAFLEFVWNCTAPNRKSRIAGA